MTMQANAASLRAPEGCVAHLVWDPSGAEALAIDPRLDQVEDLLELARARGVRVRAVMDTHTHADHLSGARRLAARAGAELLAPAESGLQAPARRVAPGSAFSVGGLEVRVLPAPGHAPDAVALLIGGRLFTGDALFIEGVGRTDFPGGSPDDLLATLASFETLPPETVVMPGHDYQSRGPATLGELRATHPVLSERDQSVRLARMSGRGAVIPDIRQMLDWNLASSETGPLPPRAAQDLAKGRSALLLDVRTPAEFGISRIDGSLNVPLQAIETHAATLPRDKEMILVCRSGLRAQTARETLGRLGIPAVVMAGGLEAWRQGGLPIVEARPGVLPLDRQVQIGAGSLVLAGVLLAAFVDPWALVLPGFVGSGLLFAGLTGTCGLARVLALMPWNRPSGAPASAPICSAGSAPTCSAGSDR